METRMALEQEQDVGARYYICSKELEAKTLLETTRSPHGSIGGALV